LGENVLESLTPKPIKSLKERVKHIYASTDHAAVITEKGNVYVRGPALQNSRVAGLGEAKTWTTPMRLSFSEATKNVRHLTLGARVWLALCEETY